MAADIAEAIEGVRAAGVQVRAVGIRAGSLYGLETVLGVPVVRLHSDSVIGWGVIL